MHGARGDYPSWLEVWTSGNEHLAGQFVGSGGSARPISQVEFANGKVRFSIPPQWDKRPDNKTYKATLTGDTLEGWTTDRTGKRLTFNGKRAPSLARSGAPAWGKPITLTSRSSWREAKGWTFSDDGVLASTGKAENLVSTQAFNDFTLHVEFRLPKGSNSGVYLRGRYEAQIEDSDAAEPPLNHIGGIYGFLAPTWDAGVSRVNGRPSTSRWSAASSRSSSTASASSAIQRFRHHRRRDRQRRGIAGPDHAAGGPRRHRVPKHHDSPGAVGADALEAPLRHVAGGDPVAACELEPATWTATGSPRPR